MNSAGDFYCNHIAKTQPKFEVLFDVKTLKSNPISFNLKQKICVDIDSLLIDIGFALFIFLKGRIK